MASPRRKGRPHGHFPSFGVVFGVIAFVVIVAVILAVNCEPEPRQKRDICEWVRPSRMSYTTLRHCEQKYGKIESFIHK